MDTKFGTNVSNRMLLHAAKFQGYSFYRFLVIRGKPTGEGGGKITPLPRLGLNKLIFQESHFHLLQISLTVIFLILNITQKLSNLR